MSLQVREVFTSIQGEGPFSGIPAVFVRFAGCNTKCAFCDTDHDSIVLELSEIELYRMIDAELQEYPLTSLIVFTGGEPFLQDFTAIIDLVEQRPRFLDGLLLPYRFQVETNGSIDPLYNFPFHKVTIVVSPKIEVPVKIRKIDAWKFLVKDGENLPQLNPDVVWLQPWDEFDAEKNAKNQKHAIELCKKHGYHLSLQLHKILKIR